VEVTTIVVGTTSPFERVVENDWVIRDGGGVVTTSTDVVTGTGDELEVV